RRGNGVSRNAQAGRAAGAPPAPAGPERASRAVRAVPREGPARLPVSAERHSVYRPTVQRRWWPQGDLANRRVSGYSLADPPTLRGAGPCDVTQWAARA